MIIGLKLNSLFWLIVGLIGMTVEQCFIQEETCTCQMNSQKTQYSISCTGRPDYSNTSTEFPALQIQTELRKYNSDVNKLEISYKNYQTLPAMAFSNMSFELIDLNSNKINTVDHQCFRGANIENLVLRVNQISNLSFLAYLFGLKSLSLCDNSIDSLQNRTFVQMSQLEKLDLKSNKVKKLEINLFQGLKNLSILYMDSNLIDSIQPGVFTDLKNLFSLSLSDNTIKELKANVFVSLIKLDFLSLDYNEISLIENNSLNNLKNLRTLHLRNNKIKFVSSDLFSPLVNIEDLYISDNEITQIEKNSFKHNKNLSRFSITKNFINKIQNESFRGLDSLVTDLDLSFQKLEYLKANCFVGLKNLLSLFLQSNNIMEISAHAFIGLDSLTNLDLRYNPFKSIATDTFYGLKSLKQLELNEMHIQYLNARSFFGLENLVFLNLSEDMVGNVSYNTFSGLGKLDILDLSNNWIEFIDIDGFSELTNVISINLSLNVLPILKPFRFNYTTSLKSLIVSNSSVVSIEKCAFCGMETSLVNLDLSINKLDYINNYYFSNLSALRVLDLSFCGILSIELGSFDNLTNLTDINLSSNCLFRIQDELFKSLVGLNVLNLKSNLIKSLSPSSLKSLNQLTSLDLQNNLIEHFEFKAVSKLTYLDISYNPLLRTFCLNEQFVSVNLNENTRLVFNLTLETYPQLNSLYAKNLVSDCLKLILSNKFPNLVELDLSNSDLGDFSSYQNVKLRRFWLKNSFLNTNLSFLDKFTNLIELDLSSTRDIVWNDEVVLAKLFKLEILKMRNLNISSFQVENCMSLDKYKNLVHLDFSSNSLIYFTINFVNSKKLRILILANNNLIAFDLSKLPTPINILDLSFNQIETVTLKTGKRCYNIYISNNNLSKINFKLMELFVLADTLDLSNNRLPFLNDSILPSIKYLNLSNNYIEYIGDIFLTFFDKPFLDMLTIDLSRNRLKAINLSFILMINLRELSLKENRFEYFEGNIFSYLKSLNKLDLGNNRLSRLEKTLFHKLSLLNYLNLNSNYIDFIHEDQFSALFNLYNLDLSNNLIERLSSNTFASLKYLSNLNICMNRLKTISMLNGFDMIQNIYLDLNLIASDYNVQNLKDSIKVAFSKQSYDRIYYKSVNIITNPRSSLNENNIKQFLNSFCNATIYLANYNILLNLETEEDSKRFVSVCDEYSNQFMFTGDRADRAMNNK